MQIQICLQTLNKSERPQGKWNNNIKTDLQGKKLAGINWIHLPQQRERRQPPMNKKMKF